MSSKAKGSAIVTGAAQGIGREIALRLAEDGYDVAVNDVLSNEEKVNDVVKLIQEKGRRGMSVLADVSVEEEVEGMVKMVVEEYGGLDVMVANAGVVVIKSMAETTVAEWDRLFSINVRGTFLCFKHAGSQMISQERGGRMLAACSGAGKKGVPDFSAYSSTKFAIRGIVQCAAQEYGRHGITVNAYAPGAVQTDMITKIEDYYANKLGLQPGQFAESAKNYTSVKRNGETQDVANLVSFLVSKEANFITGQSVIIDGGVLFD